MPPAFTLYKFKKMFGLVISIFVILIALSIANPVKDKIARKAISDIDTTGLAVDALDTYESTPNPKGEIKQASGSFLYKLLQDNPNGFIILALIVTFILFYKGIYLKDVRGFQRNLLK